MTQISVDVRIFTVNDFKSVTKIEFCEINNLLESAESSFYGSILLKHPHTGKEEQDRSTFSAEIDILTPLRHPNIELFYGAFLYNLRYSAVIEYIQGISLKNLIEDREKHIPEADVYKYMHQTSCAVEYLHDRSIVHLDIKPSNLVYDKQRDLLKIVDFDSAQKLKKGQEVLIQYTTPYYEPPELQKSATLETSFAYKIDIYCMAVTTWELFHRPEKIYIDTGYCYGKMLQNPYKRGIDAEKIKDKETAHFIQQAWCDDPTRRPTAALFRGFIKGKL